jgi:hypothetical protein
VCFHRLFPVHKGYRYLDLSTNCVVVSQHIVFYEACFPFATLPHPTNNYEFLFEIDLVLSPIRTCLSASTLTTTTGGLTVPLGGLTAPYVEAGGPTATLGGQTVPLGRTIARVAESDDSTASSSGPPACPLTLTASLAPCTTMTTLASPSVPRVALMTSASTCMPHAAPRTPPSTSSVAPVSPSAAQPVLHVLPTGVVPVSLVVHLHPMRTQGTTGFRQPKIYVAATLSLIPKLV